MIIRHNIQSMNAYRNYGINSTMLNRHVERLSSGYRVNRAGDDAAGLAISEKMRFQITGLNQGLRNAKDGISLCQTADGALEEVHGMLRRMKELSIQAANGTYSESDRRELQKEIDQILSEIDRISEASQFNGRKLFTDEDAAAVNGSVRSSAAKTLAKSIPDAAAASTAAEAASESAPAGAQSAEGAAQASEIEPVADAAGVTKGDFYIIGGTEGTDFNYNNGVLTIISNKALTIRNTNPNVATTNRIQVAAGVSADITLAGVNIDVSKTNGAAAFLIADNSAGNVTIRLADGTKNVLTSGNTRAGIHKVGASGTLTIEGGTGSLIATGGNNGAGIGSGYVVGGGSATVSGVIINGGHVTATGGNNAAGIGGGFNGSANGVTINGGNVTARGGDSAAGIGGGSGGAASNIKINSGTVSATGGNNGAGIGGGSGGAGSGITVSGGGVSATGGGNAAGIGGGSGGAGSNIEVSNGTVTATGGNNGAGIGGGNGRGGSDIRIKGGDVTAKGGQDGAGIGGGNGGDGSSIKITGGDVTATGQGGGAGVGGGTRGNGTGTTITDSSVSAQGGSAGGAGVGGGSGGNGSNTSITGSTVTAKGGSGSAGIGGGSGGTGSGTTINDSCVSAQGGSGSDGIDGAYNARDSLVVDGKTGTVTGNAKVRDDFDISGGATVEIENGASLTVEQGATLTNNGTVNNNGTFENKGTFNNNGTFNGKGTTRNSGTFNSKGTLNNDSLFENRNSGTLNNDGTVNNNNAFTNDGTVNNNGTFNNNRNGTLDNNGTFNNNGRLVNRGALNNAGTLKNSGTITGNEVEGNEVVEVPKEGEDADAGNDLAELASLNAKRFWIQYGCRKGDGMYIEIEGMDTAILGVRGIRITSVALADEALLTITSAVNKVSSIRGTIGAQTNRLEHTIANEMNMVENLTDAESIIRDTDVAQEMMGLVKVQILTQSGMSMLMQANMSVSNVLGLIQ